MLFKIYTTLLSKELVLIEISSNQDKKLEKILHFHVENPGESNKTITKDDDCFENSAERYEAI